MPLENSLPTYAELEPLIIQWAADRDLVYSDGRPYQATQATQHDKALEELREANWGLIEYVRDRNARTAHALSIELGDVLVTQVLGAAMMGKTMADCLQMAPTGSLDYPLIWPFVNCWANVVGGPYPETIGAVVRCVEDLARIELSLSGPECLLLAYHKIRSRRGQTVNGTFVKAI